MDSAIESSAFTIPGALEQLVKHYSQSVHEVEELPPYFDSLLGYPPKVPPVVKFLLNRLTKESCDKIIDWLEGYQTAIRPQLLKTSVGCVPVLQNYELVLSQWLSHITNYNEEVPPTINIEVIYRTIEMISSDLTLVTSSSRISFPPYVRTNIVLPCLLRILHQILIVVSISEAKTEFPKGPSCLIRCIVSLLAFDKVRIDPTDVAPSLVHADDNLLMTACSCPPINPEKKHNISSFLSLESVDWASVTLDSTSWNDPVTGIVLRAVHVVWKMISCLILPREGDGTVDESPRNRFLDNKLEGIQRGVLGFLGMPRMTRAVRSHFFGNDMLLMDTEKRISTQVIMGRRVTKEQPILDEKSYKSIPSRTNVVLNFVRHLGKEDGDVTRDILIDIFPPCFELIDASSPILIALGGSTLVHLLDNLDQTDDCWNGFAENALTVLDGAFTSHREGPVLVVTGQAQTRLLRILRNGEKRRREVTRHWLSLLRLSSSRPTSQMICWEIMVGGVIPLLYQHAELPNADATEMGRLGLAALLPLTTGEFVESKTQAASLVALINLMAGAHPIMPHHGGKIMSHLLVAAAGPTDDQNVERVGIREFAIHAAAVALAICGPSFAGEVVQDIIRNKDSYQDTLVQIVTRVHDLSRDLIAKDASA